MPALTGAMSPKWNASARGCFYGLTPAHGPEHLARAVMEGCAFAMRDVVDRLVELGVPVRELSLLAGGSRSSLWAQMRADVSGVPVTTPRHVHTSAIAAAMLAAVAAGDFAGLRQAAALASPPRGRYEADPDARATLADAYRRYRELCANLEPMFHEARPIQ
jgi:xylulokinase